MAIIYSYPKNTDILSTDIIVGTSTRVVNGRRKNITKNFEIGAIATFFNETSAIAITGQNNFFFQNNIAPGRKAGSISFILGGGANTPFNNITALRISKFATSGTNVSDYINTLLEQALIIAQTDNLNSFGIYRCNSITPVDGNPNFLDLELEVLNANGNILEDKFYGFAVYPGFVNPNIDPANYDFEYPLLVDGRTISIEQSTTTTDGYLSSVDWNTFNNKQNAITLTTVGSSGAATLVGNTLNIPQYQSVLTNPITGTGTISYVPRFTGTTTIGNGSIFDNGTNIGIGTTTLTEKVNIVGKIDIVDNPSYNNVFIGRMAGTSNGNGYSNTAIGYSALKNAIGTANNTVLGSGSGLFSSGSDNTIIGGSIMAFSGSNSNNTAIGYQALFQATSSSFNTAVGKNSLGNVISATYNIAVGDQSGRLLTTGTNSVYLGNFTTASSGSVTNEVVVGSNNAGIGSNTVVLGNASIVTTALRGNVGIGTTNPQYNLHINSSGSVSYLHLTNATSGSGSNDGMSIGVNSSNYLIFVREASPLYFGTDSTERMRISATGNVGIGNTTPSSSFQVGAGNGAFNWSVLTLGYGTGTPQIYNTQTTGESSIGVLTNDGTNNLRAKLFVDNTNLVWGLYNSFSNQTRPFVISSGNTEWMRISAGNVGIGTTTPGTRLDVLSTTNSIVGRFKSERTTASSIALSATSEGIGATTNIGINAFATGGTNNTDLLLGNITAPTGNYAIYSGTQSNSYFAGNVGIGTTTTRATLDVVNTPSTTLGTNIQLRIGGGNNTSGHLYQIGLGASNQTNPSSIIGAINNTGSSFGNSDIFFATRNVTTDTVPSERMRITSAGNVGIGTTNPTALLDIQPASGTSVLRVARTGGTDVRVAASITSTGGLIGTYTNSPFDIYTNSTSKVRVTETGNVGIGTTSPSPSAVLDLTSTTQGFLPPRMTTTQRTSLGVVAPPGLIVYDTDDNKHYGWNGSSWNAFY
jgi:hypothetical protein